MYISGSELWVVPEAFAIESHSNRYSYLLKPVESKWEVRIEFAIIPYTVKDFSINNNFLFRKQLRIVCILNSFEKHVFIMQEYWIQWVNGIHQKQIMLSNNVLE